MLRRGRRTGGLVGSLATTRTRELRGILADGEGLEPQPMGAEQSNSSIAFGQRAVLKIFRRVEAGPNPEAEVTATLTRAGFAHVSPPAGTIEYHRRRRQPVTIGLLQGFVTNEGDAWEYTMDEITRYLEDVLARDDPSPPAVPEARLVDLAAQEVPAEVADSIGSYLEFARLLGERTAQMHLALAGADGGSDFEPEAFTALQQRAQYQSLRNLIRQVLAAARRSGDGVAELEWIAPGDQPALAHVRGLMDGLLQGSRIRAHGDYHLGQVLWTGRDVVIIDFEGEPARPLAQRRLKRSPAYDVAGMLRSFHYAAYAALFRESGRDAAVGGPPEAWAKLWRAWVSAAFLRAYRAEVAPAGILPEDDDELARLLDLHLIEKAVYELGYELDNRPEWVVIPARGLQELLGE
jgi:maltose alpha-D-glucosyltransferase/alpha-amylase